MLVAWPWPPSQSLSSSSFHTNSTILPGRWATTCYMCILVLGREEESRGQRVKEARERQGPGPIAMHNNSMCADVWVQAGRHTCATPERHRATTKRSHGRCVCRCGDVHGSTRPQHVRVVMQQCCALDVGDNQILAAGKSALHATPLCGHPVG
jgi:hypothetical protein